MILDGVYLKKVSGKLDNRINELESENIRYKYEIDVLANKVSCIEKEKEDYRNKLEFFTKSSERKRAMEKQNQNYEDILLEQFENMKRGFLLDLEEKEKEISRILSESRKKTFKYEEEITDLNHRYRLCYSQIEEIKELYRSDIP